MRQYNHGVVFFKMGFWVRFNLKNHSKGGFFNKKVGLYSRKKKQGFSHYLGTPHWNDDLKKIIEPDELTINLL